MSFGFGKAPCSGVWMQTLYFLKWIQGNGFQQQSFSTHAGLENIIGWKPLHWQKRKVIPSHLFPVEPQETHSMKKTIESTRCMQLPKYNNILVGFGTSLDPIVDWPVLRKNNKTVISNYVIKCANYWCQTFAHSKKNKK